MQKMNPLTKGKNHLVASRRSKQPIDQAVRIPSLPHFSRRIDPSSHTAFGTSDNKSVTVFSQDVFGKLPRPKTPLVPSSYNQLSLIVFGSEQGSYLSQESPTTGECKAQRNAMIFLSKACALPPAECHDGCTLKDLSDS